MAAVHDSGPGGAAKGPARSEDKGGEVLDPSCWVRESQLADHTAQLNDSKVKINCGNGKAEESVGEYSFSAIFFGTFSDTNMQNILSYGHKIIHSWIL